MLNQRIGLADNWLQHVQDVAQKHARRLRASKVTPRAAIACASSDVVEQVANVRRTTIHPAMRGPPVRASRSTGGFTGSRTV
jgi:carbonic anhydrase